MDNRVRKVVKGLILVAFLTLGMKKGFSMEFKVNSSMEKLNGGFKKSEVVISEDKIEGKIDLRSLWSSKPKKNEDLLEYFDVEDHPVGTFKVNKKGNKLVGTGNLKGEIFELKGEISNGEARIKLSLKKLIGGFKANFIDKKDNVEMIIKLKK